MSKYDFTGRVALITGSSSGIGAATAILLAKMGAQVVITGRNVNKLENVVKQCAEVSPTGLKAVPVVADVTKEADLDRLLATTVQSFGKLDILVNNVGYWQLCPITSDDYMQHFSHIMSTNLLSAVYLTHKSVDYLIKTKGSGLNMSAYAMTKSALDMFTKCLAVELGPKGIRVNSLNPGAVYTDAMQNSFGMTEAEGRDLFDKFAADYPVGRVGEGVDVANAVAYLASNEGSFITGTNFVIDGGHIAANINVKGV
ncbi:unnamed protein product [Medioppia subpectinata]|uniref:Uncharacterized protein n=1 Tax=Medioppia subpectinata TaxID=1979941 RepID=A0A7R9KKZ8_9ACAR|nr:unnamed protein product [Medioppia subpectinata]CAG2105537.1 unnamed protein product [Medioppia subpectinata]